MEAILVGNSLEIRAIFLTEPQIIARENQLYASGVILSLGHIFDDKYLVKDTNIRQFAVVGLITGYLCIKHNNFYVVSIFLDK